MAGTYICAKRVVRDGVLVAFEGQEMTEREAEALGLVKKAASRRSEKDAGDGKEDETAKKDAEDE